MGATSESKNETISLLAYRHTVELSFSGEVTLSVMPSVAAPRSLAKPITFTVNDEDGFPRLVIWDTLVFSQQGLERMGKDCGYEKGVGEWDYGKVRTPDTPLTDAEIDYAKRDIYTLFAWVAWWLRRNPDIAPEKLGLNVVTKTGVVRERRRVRFGDLRGEGLRRKVGHYQLFRCNTEKPKSDDELFTMLAATRGGFTFCASTAASVPYDLSDSDMCVSAYDATSQHPAQLVSHYYPHQFKERNAEILDLGNVVARLEQKKLAADMEEKQILDKLWENYELSHTTAEALRQPVESLPRANKEIADLRRQINALGTPNLGAIEEYERVNSRYAFLSEQRDDVEKAKKELLDIIRDITGEMETVFLTQFKAIDAAFRETFLELFGGGKAALMLEDENHVLECGIEIKVQPPGKALSTISLMSGGEMAFVAIALYFAILKVRPTPFCVMDEIEAALDEANVSRYASYMRRMAGKTQFLVITHRRGTMEEADMLYGVTMQEKGVSTVLELDLETAQKTIEE